MVAVKVKSLRKAFSIFKNYKYPLYYYGKRTNGTVNSPFKLLLCLLKEKVVQLEIGYEIHEWSLISGVLELRILETGTNEVIEVRYFA